MAAQREQDQARAEAGEAPADPERRRFLETASKVAMVAGLAGGYGALGAIAGRFLFPPGPADRVWLFVSDLAAWKAGETLLYRAPSGEPINVTRRGTAGDAGDFIALSSTCPHLGCQVHWEAQHERYFCPCHNGTFDPQGIATGGPPGDAGQALLRYPLKVEAGLLYVEVPAARLAQDGPVGDPGHPRRCRGCDGEERG